jgi:hypothetical protein
MKEGRRCSKVERKGRKRGGKAGNVGKKAASSGNKQEVQEISRKFWN